MSADLRVQNLKVAFRTSFGYVEAVSGVDLNVGPGETVGLVGESGSGKSVTAQAVMNLLPKGARVEGSARMGDVDMLLASDSLLRRIRGRSISMIFQEPMSSLNPVLKIGDQITEPLRMHGRFTKRELREKAVELIERVGIPRAVDIVDEYPHRLSGGMRQRIMIGMAIACSPHILIADEPTTALDVTVQAQILDLLRDLQSRVGMGLLLITHDLGVVAGMCQRVAVMYAGRVVEECDVVSLFEDPKHPYTLGLLACVPDVRSNTTTLVSIPGNVPSLSTRPTGCGFVTRCPYAMDKCRHYVPPPILVSEGHHVSCWLVEGEGV